MQILRFYICKSSLLVKSSPQSSPVTPPTPHQPVNDQENFNDNILLELLEHMVNLATRVSCVNLFVQNIQ